MSLTPRAAFNKLQKMSTLLTQFKNECEEILIDKFLLDKFESTKTIQALGLDELDIVEFIMEIEKLYDKSIPDQVLEDLYTLNFDAFCETLFKEINEVPHFCETLFKEYNKVQKEELNLQQFKHSGLSIVDEPTVVYPRVEDINPNEYNVMRLAEGLFVMRSTWLCKTQNLGLHGNAFGGDLFCHLDEVSAAFVAEIIDTPLVVTVSSNVQFKSFIKSGNLLKTYCNIKSIGNTSIAINIEMRKYNVKTEKETLCVSAEMVFVRIDGEGEKIPIEKSVKEKYSKLVR